MASGPLAERSPGQDIVFELDRGYRAPLVRRGAVSVAVAGLAALLASFGFVALVTWPVAAVFGAAALLQAVLYLWRGRFRTRLSAGGIEARGYVDHFVPWPEVTGIDVGGAAMPDSEPAAIAGTPWDSPVRSPLSRVTYGSEGGYQARLATVRVSRRHGHSLLLRAPLVTSWQDDPQFDDKVRLLRQQWRDSGQTDRQQA